MNKKIRLLCVIAFLSIAFCACGRQAEKGYSGNVYIEDAARLLSDEETERLKEEMSLLTEYGDVAFVTRSDIFGGNVSESEYAADKFQQYIGGDTESGVLFLIDMKERVIWLETHGNFEEHISKNKAKSITDRVYKDASKRNYFECAKKAFQTCNRTMGGLFFFDKMKVLSNSIIAILISLVLNFVILRALNRKRETEAREYGYANKGKTVVSESKIQQISTSSVRISSGYRGGYHRSGGSFSRGGGGSHSHGGGHRF